MSIDEPVSTRGTTGAGLYGRENPRGHRCGKCNNGTGVTNPECPNAPKTSSFEEMVRYAERD